MNGYERIAAALGGRFPDTVPVMLHNFLMAADEAGFTQEEYRNDPKKMAESYITAIERYQYDGVLVDMDTTVLAGSIGVPVTFPVDGPASVHEPLLNTIGDVTTLVPVRVEDYKYVQIWLEAVRILVDHFNGEIFIRGNCDQSAFSLATMVRTPVQFMMDLYDDEQANLVIDLLEYCADASRQFIRLMAQTGCHMVSKGDSPAGPDLISPQMYQDFAFAHEKGEVEEAHSHGVPYALHICGDTTKILDLMIDTGADAVELDYKTDCDRAHAATRDRVTFIGNIDPSGILARGTEGQVIEETARLLTLFADTPRFVLNAGCAIPRGTPPENLNALIRTAREFRRPGLDLPGRSPG